MINLFNYIDRPSPIHRLTGACKLVCLIAWSLAAMSLLLLAKWEYMVRRYPHRFSETTNRCLSCGKCEEKLCHHKKQLHSFWKKNLRRVQLAGNEIFCAERDGHTSEL